jgi:HlyD family secretion protein
MTENTTRVGSAPGRSVRKIVLWSLGTLVLLGAAAYAIWWWKFRDTLHYVTARVTRGDIRRSINMTGALNPVVTAQVGSFVSGNIKSWSCDYNTQVKIGQQCALIDPLPFQVVVDEAEADVRTAKAQLVKDKAAAANAKIVYERDKKLRDQGIVSQETLDADKSTLDQDVATIDLDIATIASKEAALHAGQVNLGYTNIVSPVNGTVITRYIDVGYTVVSNLQSSTLFLIGKNMTSMQVDTNVSEADVGEVRDGQKANFTVQAYPNRTFEAAVRQVRKGPITVQNVVTYDVVLDVDNKDLALLPGMTSDTHIITAEHKNVLRVPLPATRFVPEGMGRSGRGGEGAGGRSGGGAGGGGAGAGSGAGGANGAGTGGASGAGDRSGGGSQGGSDQSAGVTGPGGTDDGLPGAGVPGVAGSIPSWQGENKSGEVGAGANGAGAQGSGNPGAQGSGGSGAAGAASGAHGSGAAGDNNQQRHHLWNRDQGAPGTDEGQKRPRLANAQNTGDQAGSGGPAGAGGQGGTAHGPGQNPHGPGTGPDAGGAAGGAGAARRARGPRAMARIWVLRNGQLTPVAVRTGLDDGTLIEVFSDDLKEGDEVVVNAVRPNAPRPAAGDRTPGQGQPNAAGGRGTPGGGGAGFRL